MTFARGSLSDPFIAANWSNPDIYFQARLVYWRFGPGSYSARSPRIDPAIRTGVFLVAGQSNGAAYAVGAPYIPTNAAVVDSLSIFDGGVYEGKDPGPNMDGTGTSWLYRLADKLIASSVYDRVIMIPAAMGSAASDYYMADGPLVGFIPSAHRRCQSMGMNITAILWQQGERDGGTGVTTDQYVENLQSIIAICRAAGCDAPWLVAKSTYQGNVTSGAIRAACDQLVDGVDVFAGPDTDALGGVTYRADTTHFNAVGADAAATLWMNAITAAL